jgi:hypothetical protein
MFVPERSARERAHRRSRCEAAADGKQADGRPAVAVGEDDAEPVVGDDAVALTFRISECGG